MLKIAQMTSRNALSGFLLILLGAGIFFLARTFPELPEGHPGPGLFPGILGIGLLLTGLFLLVQQIGKMRRSDSVEAAKGRFLPLIAGIILIVLFPVVQPLLGTYPALGLVGIGVGFTLQLKPVMVIITVAATLGLIFLAFNLMLGLPL